MKQNKLTQVEKDALVVFCIASTVISVYPNQEEKKKIDKNNGV